MANEQNLRPILDSQRARELQEKSVEKRKQNIAERKTLREELLALLAQGKTQEKLSLSLIEKALNGDTKAFEVIRDTIGEKPTEKVEQSGESKLTISLQGDVGDWAK
jgi:phage shock protein A